MALELPLLTLPELRDSASMLKLVSQLAQTTAPLVAQSVPVAATPSGPAKGAPCG